MNERELFEEWYEYHHNGRQASCDYICEEKSYSSGYINTLWIGWQASANREGYKLVPVDALETLVTYGTQYAIEYDIDDLHKALELTK